MSDYSKTTNFTAKDALPSGNAAKVIKGSEHDTEFDNIATAVATKANKVTSPTTDALLKQTASGDLADAGMNTHTNGLEVDLVDSNGNEVLKRASVGSAVNEVTITNAATGVNPKIGSSGEANTGLIIEDSNSNEIIIAESVSSAVNELTVTNAITTEAPSIKPTGTDTNINVEIDGKGTGRLTTKATPVYGMVILDTPEVIASAALTHDAWTTINSTTLNTAQAKSAIIKVVLELSKASTTTVQGEVSLRKTGSGLAFGTSITKACNETEQAASTSTLNINSTSTTTVNLDTSYDFDYYYTTTATLATDLTEIVLVGYYV